MAYTVEIDAVRKEDWSALLHDFEDATIFQTSAYGAARWGEQNLSRLVIRKNGEIVGLAQTVLAGIPFLGRSLALVTYGPLWQRQGAGKDVEDLRVTLNALHEEYVQRRNLFMHLRMWPYDLPQEEAVAMLVGGRWQRSERASMTYILDLSRPECELRGAMDKKWRANLRKAEQSGLAVSRLGLADGLSTFSRLHSEMRNRKRFVSNFLEVLPSPCDALPDKCEPNVFICCRGRKAIASAIVSAIGSRAFYLNGATANDALEVRGGHFLQWAIVRWLKEQTRCRWYDLNGVMSSPGVRQFKRGLIGRKAPEILIHEYEACNSDLTAFLIRSGIRFRRSHRDLWLRAKHALRKARVR